VVLICRIRPPSKHSYELEYSRSRRLRDAPGLRRENTVAGDALVLGILLFTLLVLRILRLREMRAQRSHVVWIAQGDEVKRLLAALDGEYRLTPQEVRNTWMGGGLLALLASLAVGRLVSVWWRGPGTSSPDDLGRMLSFPPAVAAGGLMLGVGLLATRWRTEVTHSIRPESVEEHSGRLGSWQLRGAEIARVGRQHIGLVLETRSRLHRIVPTGEALQAALRSRE